MHYGEMIFFFFLISVVDPAIFPKCFPQYLKNKSGRHILKTACMREQIKEGIINDEFYNSFQTPRRSRFIRKTKENELNKEIDEVKIVPITSVSDNKIYCYKQTPELVSCKQKDLRFDIKLKHSKGLSDDSLASLVRSLMTRLGETREGISLRRKKEMDFVPVTIHPGLNGPPLMVFLPPATTPPPWICPTITSPWPFTPGFLCPVTEDHPCFASKERLLSIDCSPTRFEPNDPSNQVLDTDYDTTTGKSREAYVYSCRWQGAKQTEEDTFLVPVSPPEIELLES